MNIMKKIIGILLFCVVLGVWFAYVQFFTEPDTAPEETITFVVNTNMTARDIATKLFDDRLIRDPKMFLLYLRAKKLDTKIHAGEFVLTPPFTITRIVETIIQETSKEEVSYTIIPGWTIRDVAEYFVTKGLATTTADVYQYIGTPLGYAEPTLSEIDTLETIERKPDGLSLEGYLRPDTYRFYASDTIETVLKRFVVERDKEFSLDDFQKISGQGRSLHQVLTVASIVEREVRTKEDKRKVADIFWRRYDVGMGLQADSTVHYITGERGNVFTSAGDRNIDSPWNTYKYSGLPPGPISIPSWETIEATLNPEANEYWFFLTDFDGGVHYGRTLDEHNQNVQTYLR